MTDTIDTLRLWKKGLLPEDNHVVMVHWLKSYRNPRVASIKSLAGMMVYFLSLTLVLGAVLAMDWVSVDLQRTLRLLMIIAACSMAGSFIVWFIYDLSLSGFPWRMLKAVQLLDMTLREFTQASAEKLRELADEKIRECVATVLEAEKIYTPYHPRRKEAQNRFEDTYEVLAEVGLIADIVYESYFKSSQP